jgi:diaminopimelate epimerase
MNFPVKFTKMSGTGNDFIIIDHRQEIIAPENQSTFCQAVCRRNFSVGADGLILIENSDTADFSWKFFNADGTDAEMCGNGARCAARFAFDNNIAPEKMTFNTIAGIIEAECGKFVKIKLTEPFGFTDGREIDLDGKKIVYSINTGVPHAVCFVDNIAEAPVEKWGPVIRYHDFFSPAGTNVNFVGKSGSGSLVVRTYERGVEGETMACGTGAVAAAAIGVGLNMVEAPVAVITSGGEKLNIHLPEFNFEKSKKISGSVFLEGPASHIYTGELQEDAVSAIMK